MSDWPLKLQLSPLDTLKDQAVLLAADCAAVLCPNLARHHLGKRLLLACPKLENKEELVEKLVQLIKAGPHNLEILRMQVPCCCLPDLLKKAEAMCGTALPVSISVITIKGHEPLNIRPKSREKA